MELTDEKKVDFIGYAPRGQALEILLPRVLGAVKDHGYLWGPTPPTATQLVVNRSDLLIELKPQAYTATVSVRDNNDGHNWLVLTCLIHSCPNGEFMDRRVSLRTYRHGDWVARLFADFKTDTRWLLDETMSHFEPPVVKSLLREMYTKGIRGLG
jgi:hypothetical protein